MGWRESQLPFPKWAYQVATSRPQFLDRAADAGGRWEGCYHQQSAYLGGWLLWKQFGHHFANVARPE